MVVYSRSVKRDEILRLAVQAKLMHADGNSCYLKDTASDKEVIAFARLLELKLNQQASSDMVGAE